MKTRIYLYSLIILSVLLQITIMGRFAWFPDITILVVVFTGIFLGGAKGAEVGLLAGILRGAFSVGTFPLDIFLFPTVGAVASMLGKMFYRQNPAAQIFTTTISMFIVVVGHIAYLNAAYLNDVEISIVVRSSWSTIIITALISPVAFILFREFLHIEE